MDRQKLLVPFVILEHQLRKPTSKSRTFLVEGDSDGDQEKNIEVRAPVAYLCAAVCKYNGSVPGSLLLSKARSSETIVEVTH